MQGLSTVQCRQSLFSRVSILRVAEFMRIAPSKAAFEVLLARVINILNFICICGVTATTQNSRQYPSKYHLQ